jgi:hypothetical protein
MSGPATLTNNELLCMIGIFESGTELCLSALQTWDM